MNVSFSDAASVLGVLFLQTVRVRRHTLLRVKEEEQPSDMASSLPPFIDAIRGMASRQVHCRLVNML